MAEDLFGVPVAEEEQLFGVPVSQEQSLLGQPVSQITEPDAEKEEETSTFSDVAQGVGAGLIGLPQGIAETGAAIVDSIADTNTSREVTSAFETAKDFLGLTPETTAGKTAESITTFGAALIPVIGWVGRASSVARGAALSPLKVYLKLVLMLLVNQKQGRLSLHQIMHLLQELNWQLPQAWQEVPLRC